MKKIYVEDSFQAHFEAQKLHKDIVSLKVKDVWIRGEGVKLIVNGKTIDGQKFQKTFWKK